VKNILKSWAFFLLTVGPMVAVEFFDAPWLPFAARLGYFVQVAFLVSSIIFILMCLGMDGHPSVKSLYETLRKIPKRNRVNAKILGFLTLAIFAAMGWYVLAAAQVVTMLLSAVLRNDVEKVVAC
jgi:uncharacterized membrane protein